MLLLDELISVLSFSAVSPLFSMSSMCCFWICPLHILRSWQLSASLSRDLLTLLCLLTWVPLEVPHRSLGSWWLANLGAINRWALMSSPALCSMHSHSFSTHAVLRFLLQLSAQQEEELEVFIGGGRRAREHDMHSINLSDAWLLPTWIIFPFFCYFLFGLVGWFFVVSFFLNSSGG